MADEDPTNGELFSLIQELQNRLEVLEEASTSDDGSRNDKVIWLPIGGNSELGTLPDDGSANNDEDEDDEDDDDELDTRVSKLPMDVYSILATWEWNSKPFWISLLVVFGFQITLISLLLIDQTNAGSDNPLILPANVEITVRLAQVLAIMIALFLQDDIRTGIEGLFNGLPTHFQSKDRRFQRTVNLGQWKMAFFLRFAQGFLVLFAAFLLVIQAETVFDLLLNFLGVGFISEIDNVAFRLSALGYLGRRMKKAATVISKAKFYNDNKKKGGSSILTSPNIIGLFSLLIGLLALYSFFSYQQVVGVYSVDTVLMEFGDQTLPYLGLFNGCYNASTSANRPSRLVYEQIGVENGGKFGYCSDLDDIDGGDVAAAWTFYVGDDPCDDYVARSGETRTFDLLEAALSTQWYTRDNQILSDIQGSEVLNYTKGCGAALFQESLDSCGQIQFDGTLDVPQSFLLSRSFEKLTFESIKQESSILSQNGLLDATLSHPIYIAPESNSSTGIILFTGLHWVLTSTDNITNVDVQSASEAKFWYRNDHQGFEAAKQNQNWVLLISEPVESATDQGTPLGLRWYETRYEQDSNKAADEFGFPSVDVTRSVNGAFFCSKCNSNSNPCDFEGECDDTSGECSCRYGTEGALCQITPVGNGVCNDEFFNKRDFGFDGGDCCGGTCRGASCGENGIKLPYGMDNITTEGFFGYEQCQDPDMAAFTVVVECDGWGECESNTMIQYLSVKCEETPYLLIPAIPKVDGVATYRQTIHVPFGASCEVMHGGEEGVTLYLYYGENTTSTRAIIEFDYDSDCDIDDDNIQAVCVMRLKWDVPKSKCIAETIFGLDSSYFRGTVFDQSSDEAKATQRLDEDGMSASWCESDNQTDLLLERYALHMLDLSLGIGALLVDVNQCEGWGDKNFVIDCAGGTKVESLELFLSGGRGFIPTELGLLTELRHLSILSEDDDELLVSSIPTELGRLQKLTYLDLSWNDLYGSIPSEIGNLQSLREMWLAGNGVREFYGLRDAIPTEFGNLSSLEVLDLYKNKLSGPIPRELGKLQTLTHIYLNGNNLNGAIPNELSNLGNLDTCMLKGQTPGNEGLYGFSEKCRGPENCKDFEEWYGWNDWGSRTRCGTYDWDEWCSNSTAPGLGSANAYDACCACGGGTLCEPTANATTGSTECMFPRNKTCQDRTGWVDSEGNGCDWYDAFSYKCTWDQASSNDGIVASVACCSCGGGSFA